MNGEADADHTCEVCGLPFDSEEELEEHKQAAHSAGQGSRESATGT